jgi:methyl-accepting chemotaxis protein
MHILSRFKLRAKLTMLLGLSALAVVLSIGAAAWLMHDRMFGDRIDKLRAVVQSTISIAKSLESRVAVHQLTREQALALLRDDVHALRFDDGGGYVYAQTLDNMVMLHGTNPAMEGKAVPTSTVNENGRPITELIRDALRNSDSGVVSYSFPKPGQTQLEPKVSYVARFAPWDLVFVAGAYVDDIDAAFHAILFRLGVIAGAVLSVTLLAAFLVNRDITG